MKIRLQDIPDNGLTLEFQEDTVLECDKNTGVSALLPVNVHLNVRKLDDGIYLGGKIDSVLSLRCARCLKQFEFKTAPAVELTFKIKDHHARERELKPEDLDVRCISHGEIDVSEIVAEQLALELPIKPLCKEDCKGICAYCGIDLNCDTCNCKDTVKVDSRLKKLKYFKVKPRS